ncbi:U-box domain-containing protein 21 [Hordeum vulgare]|nr:U-box domain-containing protein 21 [Hordeum vulgare]
MIHDRCVANRAERVPTPKACLPGFTQALVLALSHGDVAARASDAIVLHELASSIDQHTVDVMSRMPGMCSALVGLAKNPVSPQVTKATLVTAYYLIFGCERMAACLLVSVVSDLLVDVDKEANEKALAVLNSLPCGVR